MPSPAFRRQATELLSVRTSLAVCGLEFRYRTRDQILLSNVSATFEPGAITAVTGPSGSGKSTLLYILGLMLVPEKGSVVVNGTDTSSLSDRERSRLRNSEIGFVFQDAILDPSRSVMDNVLEPAIFADISRGFAKERANELLEHFGLLHRVSHRPGQISGGQAQRVALCRALLLSPGILLCDEPTGNLDSVTSATVWSFLQDQALRGCTIVVATHDEELASSADARIEIDP